MRVTLPLIKFLMHIGVSVGCAVCGDQQIRVLKYGTFVGISFIWQGHWAS